MRSVAPPAREQQSMHCTAKGSRNMFRLLSFCDLRLIGEAKKLMVYKKVGRTNIHNGNRSMAAGALESPHREAGSPALNGSAPLPGGVRHLGRMRRPPVGVLGSA